jgi:hypothetical protein
MGGAEALATILGLLNDEQLATIKKLAVRFALTIRGVR